MALSGIEVQHADDGYSRRGTFGGSLVHGVFLMYSPDSTKVYGSTGGEFEGIGSLWGLTCQVLKSCSQGHFLFTCSMFIHFCGRMYRLATIHSVTDIQTDRPPDRQTERRQYRANANHTAYDLIN